MEKVDEVVIQRVSAGTELNHKRPEKAKLLDIEELTALLVENQKELDSNSKLGLLSVLLPRLKRLPRHLTP
ncbi:hypothetical protein [Pedosphaera parvula]|nr:hypothetical protein [Pedosphaera parvula]